MLGFRCKLEIVLSSVGGVGFQAVSDFGENWILDLGFSFDGGI